MRIPHDAYPTPKPHILAVLREMPDTVLAGNGLLDPCCGTGSVLEVARDFGLIDIQGIELQPELADTARGQGFPVTTADALTVEWPKVDLIVTNPPYSLAEALLRKALASATTVSFLLRLGFLASDERTSFFAEHGMPDVAVVKRPSFCMTVRCRECGDRYTLPPDSPRPRSCVCGLPALAISTVDATDYAWMTWGPEHTARVSRLCV